MKTTLWIAAIASGAGLAMFSANAQEDSGRAPGKRHEQTVLWHNPGHVENLDLEAGPGGKSGNPKPPFTFVEEDLGGTNPKIKVVDAAGRQWSAKFGEEVRAETLAAKLAWAVGYFTEINYYVASGTVVNSHGLKRAKNWIGEDGHFADSRFQLRSKNPEFLKDMDWGWNDNPFVGSRELNGLKVMMMLTSNWDNKDSRDRERAGSNLFVFRDRQGQHSRLLYEVTDWGAAMGKWGKVLTRSKWDCKGFAEQTPSFVLGEKKGIVKWGYHGQHTDMTHGIHIGEVKWLLQYLGRLRDEQIRAALVASGAAPPEVDCFARTIRQRIDQLKAL